MATTRIIGIDPGYDRLGIAVIERIRPGSERVVYSDCFKTAARDDIYVRFGQIATEVTRVLNEFKPSELSIETLFITKNQKTAMRVAEIRGIIISEAIKCGLTIHEYTPMQIKVAITSDGTSDKDRIIKMIHFLIPMPVRKTVDDEYDAIAAALTHSAYMK